MPRGPRIELAGGIHHVTARTPSGRLLFVDDEDRQRYLRLLAREAGVRDWELLSYCLMSNHVHLLVRTPRTNLGLGIKAAHEEFARSINERYDQHGHVFGRRYDNRIVGDDQYLLACFRYIAMNPVAAGMCGTAGSWPWSAHRALVGEADPEPFLALEKALALIGGNARRGRSMYVELTAPSNREVLARLAQGSDKSWVVTAIRRYGISRAEIADFLGVSETAVRRRLRRLGVQKGTVPFWTVSGSLAPAVG